MTIPEDRQRFFFNVKHRNVRKEINHMEIGDMKIYVVNLGKYNEGADTADGLMCQ